MKSMHYCLIAAVCLFSQVLKLKGDVPHQRGIIILVVDNTMVPHPVGTKISRLIDDLVGDGWRVLRHDVNRGTVPIEGNSQSVQQDAPQIRAIRAMIKADYDAAPNDVKAVFIIGHVPVPYSGHSAEISGGHYLGTHPADAFYGEMTSPLGPGGWTDAITFQAPYWPE